MKVYLESLGCKLNQCERETLAKGFDNAGHTVVGTPQEADVCVVNTCAVTQTAAGKSRRRFHHLRRANPAARLVATGCYATLDGEDLDVDLAVINDLKEDLIALVEARVEGWGILPSSSGCQPILTSRTRPMVKIQDGCDNACAYCIVHILRGKQRSRPREAILQEVSNLVQQGYHEVVLTGVHVGAYGRDLDDSLVGLVRAILDHAPPERLRLSSIEPWDLTPGFFALWQDPRLCKHLHLPLQSGCDDTLSRMNRRYTTDQYAELVARARAAIPDLALTTDVIAGFPGESEQAFAETAAFVERMAFARAHVFCYSARPGTLAAEMPEQVPLDVRRQRARALREIAQLSAEAFRQCFLGRTMPVLWEVQQRNGLWSGLTDNYVRVYADSDQDLSNMVHDVVLERLDADGVRGRLV